MIAVALPLHGAQVRLVVELFSASSGSPAEG